MWEATAIWHKGDGPQMFGSEARKAINEIGPVVGLAALVADRRRVHAAAALVFGISAAAAALSQQADRPITAALIFLLGVTIVGTLEGVAGGVVAALAASACYNFFMAEPTFRFSLGSIEHLVPLIAFNASAVASGYLTGRLRDRTRAIETANRRLEALLELSRRLQGAFHPDQVPAALDAFPGPGVRFELHLEDGGAIEPVGQTSHGDFARRLFDTGRQSLDEPARSAVRLQSADGPLGVLVIAGANGAPLGIEPGDASAIATLASLALERCVLLRRLSDAELVRKSEQFKSTLLSSVSHDIRTPLGAISASASSLAGYGDELPQSARDDLLSMIQEQCHRLDRYTANLLNLSRLQAGLDPLVFTPVDAIEALGAAIGQVRTHARNHAFVKQYDTSEALVRADPVMLEQVFHNVLDNAVRYSSDGAKITITAGVGRGCLTISIRDRGCGIAPGDCQRVFDRFYRAPNVAGGEGRGLGLAIAKGFTEAFGGRIWIGVPGDAGGGSIVSIELPLADDGGKAES